MSKYFYIKKIVRDDKTALVFDQKEIFLDDDNSLLSRPEIETTSVEYTEADGGEMVAQRLNSGTQVINGIIVPKTTDYWTLRNRLTAFFQHNHTYFIVYEKISGDTISVGEKFKTGNAWIADNLQVHPEPRENFSRFSVTLGIGTAGFQEYSENASGEEIYANSVAIGLITESSGGEEWDATGQVWDSRGQVWVTGDGGIQNVHVNSTSIVYPVWTLSGESVNPTIRNNSTNTEATYNGTVAEGQTLLVDFSSGIATLDGVVVTRNLSGEFKLNPGDNLIAFDQESGTTTSSTIKWNNFIQ